MGKHSETGKPEKKSKMRRLGRVELHTNIVDSGDLGWQIMAKFKLLPWDVRYDAAREVVMMLGTSPHFDEIEEGAAAPYYIVKVFTEKETVTSISVTREKQDDVGELKIPMVGTLQ